MAMHPRHDIKVQCRRLHCSRWMEGAGMIRSTLTRNVTWGGQVFAVERWLPSFEVTL